MENKITLEQLTTFIAEKTDLAFADFEYNESAIDSKDIIILQANYDNESYNAVCDNNVDSLLNLIVKIFIMDFNFEDDQDRYLPEYLLGKESETYNTLSALSDKLNELPSWSFQELSLDDFKEKIIDAILEDLNS